MVCAPANPPAATPFSDLAGFLIERNYANLGCNRWDSRRVMVLMAKLGDTPGVFAGRLRVKVRDFERRMETDAWTKQDGLILTMLDREIDFLKGDAVPAGRLVDGGGA